MIDPGAVANAGPDALFVVDTTGRLVWANPATEAVVGWGASEIGRSVFDIVHPDDASLVLSSVESVQGKPVGTPIEVRVLRPDGTWRWLEIIGRDCSDVPGVEGIVATARDLTQRRMWEVAAGDAAHLQQVVQHARSIVLLLDADGAVTSVNGAFGRLLGHDPSVVVGSPLERFVDPSARADLGVALAEARDRRLATVELAMRRHLGGDPLLVRLEIVASLDDPVLPGYIVTGHDMSELQEARHRLEHLATHDELTGLPNRALLRDRLDELMRGGCSLAVLYLDLDRFKPVNDALGHDAGDELLRIVARRLTAGIAQGDFVARVGGDEFVVVARRIADRPTAEALAARLAGLIGAPFALRAGPAQVGVSVGVAVAAPGVTARELLLEADYAMYATKRHGAPGAVA